jgi:hypothetical protein
MGLVENASPFCVLAQRRKEERPAAILVARAFMLTSQYRLLRTDLFHSGAGLSLTSSWLISERSPKSPLTIFSCAAQDVLVGGHYRTPTGLFRATSWWRRRRSGIGRAKFPALRLLAGSVKITFYFRLGPPRQPGFNAIACCLVRIPSIHQLVLSVAIPSATLDQFALNYTSFHDRPLLIALEIFLPAWLHQLSQATVP